LEVRQVGDAFHIRSNDDLILIPALSGHVLEIGAVSGDMDLRVFEKAIAISTALAAICRSIA
jgi:hypothetical protein